MTPALPQERAATGIEGLDNVLGGGLPANHLYALQGGPGSGKTTLALQFLLTGLAAGETGLYVTLSETAEELSAIAHSHGWSLEGLAIYEPPAAARGIERSAPQTMFLPAEVELEEITRPLLAEIERVNPQRVVLDSVSEIRLLAREALPYRREILALKRYFAGRGCTVLIIDEMPTETSDVLIRSVVHGVLLLEREVVQYGPPRRRITVDKLRGCAYREGFHDYRIRTGGIEVYPRLIASEHQLGFKPESLPSGIPELDALLGGGLCLGTSTLLLGPAGTGKSTIAARYALGAAEQGKSAAMYIFDESVGTLTHRCASLGMDLSPHLHSGQIVMHQVNPAELTPGQLTDSVRRMVAERNTRLVILDSLNGYFQSVPNEPYMSLHMHELLNYLHYKGVATILVLSQQGLVGSLTHVPIDMTYLADTVVLLRFFEAKGEVRQAISVVKKRDGHHERTIREFRILDDGLSVGPPLVEFQGVLTGVPEYRGPSLGYVSRESGAGEGETGAGR